MDKKCSLNTAFKCEKPSMNNCVSFCNEFKEVFLREKKSEEKIFPTKRTKRYPPNTVNDYGYKDWREW